MTYNDQVAQHDAVLMAEAGAGQDGGAQTRILDVNGQPGRHQRGVARGQGQRGIQQGAQVHASGARCGVSGQREVGADAGIQDFQFNLCRHESFSIGSPGDRVVLQEPGAPGMFNGLRVDNGVQSGRQDDGPASAYRPGAGRLDPLARRRSGRCHRH